VNKTLRNLPTEERERLRKRRRPAWVSPMLATLTKERFSDDAWIYERKLDGERCLAFKGDGSVSLKSRNKKELNETYPELVAALEDQKPDDFIVDGEIVAFQGNVTSFERLQQRMKIKDPEKARDKGVAVYYYIFDIVYLDGYDLSRLTLDARKRVLQETLAFASPLRMVEHRRGGGEAYYRQACRKGWEGVIAKDGRSAYASSRSRDWLKFKCVSNQELVIGGYTDPKGSRTGFGALLVGYYKGGKLKYAGKVGTGYDEETLRDLAGILRSLERSTPAFEGDGLPHKGVHWVEPRLVGQFGFSEWTKDGKLRHPRFLGLRRDKSPKDVVKEEQSS
jgi:bifunctional non-homologous end joining protein LigD